MPMDYNHDDGNQEPEFWVPTDGEYLFSVMKVTQVDFRASKANPEGSSGYKFELAVAAGGPHDSKCFENVITRGKKNTTWKLKQICGAIGLEYTHNLEAWDFENKSGRASFVTEKYGKYTNLKVDSYIEAEAKPPIITTPRTGVVEDDNVPF